MTKSLERLVDFFEMFSESGAIARERVGEESDNLAVTEYTRPPPPFIIDLTLNHNSNASFFNEPPVKLTTSLDQVCSRVLNVFDNIVHAFDDFETVRPNTRSHAKKYLKVIDPQEELVVSARQRIVGIIQENMAVSMAALHVYEPYGYLIQKDAHRNNDTIDLESVDEVIDKFEKSCEDLGALPTTIPLVLVTLTSSGLHSAFDKIAEQNRRIAIEKIASEVSKERWREAGGTKLAAQSGRHEAGGMKRVAKTTGAKRPAQSDRRNVTAKRPAPLPFPSLSRLQPPLPFPSLPPSPPPFSPISALAVHESQQRNAQVRAVALEQAQQEADEHRRADPDGEFLRERQGDGSARAGDGGERSEAAGHVSVHAQQFARRHAGHGEHDVPAARGAAIAVREGD